VGGCGCAGVHVGVSVGVYCDRLLLLETHVFAVGLFCAFVVGLFCTFVVGLFCAYDTL
jgi:hypothetical protein